MTREQPARQGAPPQLLVLWALVRWATHASALLLALTGLALSTATSSIEESAHGARISAAPAPSPERTTVVAPAARTRPRVCHSPLPGRLPTLTTHLGTRAVTPKRVYRLVESFDDDQRPASPAFLVRRRIPRMESGDPPRTSA